MERVGGFLALLVWVVALIALVGFFAFFDARITKKRRAKYTWEGKDVKPIGVNSDYKRSLEKHVNNVQDWQRTHGAIEEAEREVGDDSDPQA